MVDRRFLYEGPERRVSGEHDRRQHGKDLRTANAALAVAAVQFKTLAEEMEELAQRDPLTGLLNRATLEARIATAILEASMADLRVAVCFIDLDKFKEVNDTMGHKVGDALLQAAANRLHSVLRADDVVARIGGDEFVVVITGIRETGVLLDKVTRMHKKLILPYTLDMQNVVIGASVGVAVYPTDSNDAVMLVAHADKAMYCAKASSNSIHFYEDLD